MRQKELSLMHKSIAGERGNALEKEIQELDRGARTPHAHIIPVYVSQ
jgi:hypothetical protein